MSETAPTPPDTSQLSASKMKRLSKDALIKLVQQKDKESEEQNEVQSKLAILMQHMLAEMAEVRKTNEKVLDVVEGMARIERELKEVKEENENLRATLTKQQSFLERLANKERECNVVITGLAEKKDELGTSDEAKTERIFTSIGFTSKVEVLESRRLGTDDGRANPRRPLLLTFSTKGTKNNVLERAKQLKSYTGPNNEQLKKVYIRRDTHPAWRKEHRRLHQLVEEETNKPCNAGCNIVYNFKDKVVTRDGLVIDRFSAQF